MSVVHRIPRGALLIALMAATAFALIMPIDAQIYAYSEDMEEINSISAGRVDVVELCSDQCAYSNSDDLCEDSGPNSLYNTCFLGTDCSDCGPQTYAMFPTLADAVSTFSNEGGVFEGYLFIYNTTLTSLEGMESVTGITGNFIVRNNRELSSIAALSNLTFVDGTLYFSDNALESTDGLESLTSVGYYFDLLQENNLLTMNIPSLVSVGAQLTLADNPNVTVTDFPRLTEVGTFEFNGFTNVERVLFPSLTRTETFFFSFFGKNPSEVDLGSLEYIDGDLYINDNSFVTSLDDLFDSLQIVNGSVYIFRNGAVYGGSTTHRTKHQRFITWKT